MSGGIVFTKDQDALLEATKSTYVEACPGAGKTRTIIQRFTNRVNPESRRGMALISFTNAVVDEARLRCVGEPDLMRSPNFIGTIDSFINQFIVRPLLTGSTGRTQTFHSTWQHLPGSVVVAKGVPAQTQLDWFDFVMDGTASLSFKKIPVDRVSSISRLQAWQITSLETQAQLQWLRNIRRGVLDAAASRLFLANYLNDPSTRRYLIELLRSRFYEVIVDEVQDCSKEDVALLQLLLDSDVRLILVGDPEQAIYGFRGGSTSDLTVLLASVVPGRRLAGNFRSSPAICAAVDSLRSSTLKDTAVGANATLEHPVQLISYKRPKGAHSQISALLSNYGIDGKSTVFLAHSGAKARSCAGGSTVPTSSSVSRLVVLATTVHVLQDESAPPRARAEALNAMESLIHHLTPPALADLSREEYLDKVNLSARTYRELCLRLAMTLPAPYDSVPSIFKAALKAHVKAQDLMGWVTSGLQTPKGDKWATKPTASTSVYHHSTIHAFKGLQMPAVVLILPEHLSGSAKSDGLSQWTEGKSGEERNVLYVGASRAEKLLIIAAHETVVGEVKANLERDGVVHDLV